MKRLCDIPLEQKGEVIDIKAQGLLKERFLSLGITKGTPLVPIRKGPKNNLTVYLIRGVMIALRLEEASLITVKEDGFFGAY